MRDKTLTIIMHKELNNSTWCIARGLRYEGDDQNIWEKIFYDQHPTKSGLTDPIKRAHEQEKMNNSHWHLMHTRDKQCMSCWRHPANNIQPTEIVDLLNSFHKQKS